MWWWQSVAFGGAFVFGFSVPLEFGTSCAAAGREAVAPAAMPGTAAKIVRRRRFETAIG
jgi:hypothetical protein